jgi:hypothetical protein
MCSCENAARKHFYEQYLHVFLEFCFVELYTYSQIISTYSNVIDLIQIKKENLYLLAFIEMLFICLNHYLILVDNKYHKLQYNRRFARPSVRPHFLARGTTLKLQEVSTETTRSINKELCK